MEDLTKIQIPLTVLDPDYVKNPFKRDNVFEYKEVDLGGGEINIKKKPGRKKILENRPITDNFRVLNNFIMLEPKKIDAKLSYQTNKAEYLKIKEKFKEEIDFLGVQTQEDRKGYSTLNSTFINLTNDKCSLFYHDNSKLMKLVDGVIAESLTLPEDRISFDTIRKKIISKKNEPSDKNFILNKTLNQFYK